MFIEERTWTAEGGRAGGHGLDLRMGELVRCEQCCAAVGAGVSLLVSPGQPEGYAVAVEIVVTWCYAYHGGCVWSSGWGFEIVQAYGALCRTSLAGLSGSGGNEVVGEVGFLGWYCHRA
jgi:hypothetical protein